MRPTRRQVLAATVSSVAIAGCAESDDETDAPEDGGGDGDGGGGADDTPTATPDSTETPTASPTESMGDATVQVSSHSELGDILVDSEGETLYMFDPDTQGEGASTCYDDCADAWPPLTVDEEPSPGDGVSADLETFEREDGSMQVSANGWPLYYFVNDEEPGDANGQGANDVWWVLGPDGAPVRPESTETATEESESVTVEVSSHSELGDILVDSEGETLYMFDPDTQGEGASTCYDDCADAWPPLTVDEEPTAGDDVDAELTTFEREDGSMQVSANGWPLYYFVNDEEPGDANGQGANDVWWVLRPDGTPVRPDSDETVQTRSHSDLGDVLVDADGITLYMFDSDTQGEGASTCSGGCADAWPPLTAEEEPSAADDVDAELTTFEREDGSMQVSANGWPLYYYVDDEEPGDVAGQGVNDVWWVLDPSGEPVREESAADESSTETSTSTPTPTETDSSDGPY